MGRLAGAVDDHVDRAEAPLGLGHDPLRRVGVGHIEGEVGGATVARRSGAPALGRRRFDLVAAAGDQQDLSAGLAQQPRGRPADAAAGPGDDARLAGEAEVHQPPARRSVVTISAPALRIRCTGHLPAIDHDAARAARRRAASGRSSGDVEAGGSPARRPLEVDVDLETADVPALAVGVHLDRDRRAGRERCGEQPGRRGAGVGAAVAQRLVDDDRVAVDLDVVGEALAPAGGGHQPSAAFAAALEQGGVGDVGEAGHRVDEVGGAVEVSEDRPRRRAPRRRRAR